MNESESRHKHKSDQELDQNVVRSPKRQHRLKIVEMENREPLMINVVSCLQYLMVCIWLKTHEISFWKWCTFCHVLGRLWLTRQIIFKERKFVFRYEKSGICLLFCFGFFGFVCLYHCTLESVFHYGRNFRANRETKQFDWLARNTDVITTQSHSLFASSREKKSSRGNEFETHQTFTKFSLFFQPRETQGSNLFAVEPSEVLSCVSWPQYWNKISHVN